MNWDIAYLLRLSLPQHSISFCKLVIGELYMVVMDQVNGKSIWQLQEENEPVPAIVSKKVREAVNLLLTKTIVFGDLREYNILYVASEDSGKGHVVLVDSDWPRRTGRVDIQHRPTLRMPEQMRLCDIVLCTNPLIYGNWIGWYVFVVLDRGAAMLNVDDGS